MVDPVEEARKAAEKAILEAERLGRLRAQFSDLKKHVNRWNTVRYCSALVNSQVTDIEVRHNCGCCSDSPLEVWPYIETPDGRVYSDPPYFRVGEKYYVGGDRPYANWEEQLRKAQIPDSLVTRVSHCFTTEETASEESYEF